MPARHEAVGHRDGVAHDLGSNGANVHVWHLPGLNRLEAPTAQAAPAEPEGSRHGGEGVSHWIVNRRLEAAWCLLVLNFDDPVPHSRQRRQVAVNGLRLQGRPKAAATAGWMRSPR